MVFSFSQFIHSMAFLATAAALFLNSSTAFTSPSPSTNFRPASVLAMSRDDVENGGKRIAASAVAAGWLLTAAVSTEAAFADQPTFADSSSVVLAARSGGRAGGRAMRSSPRSMPRSTGGTTVINKRTTVVSPPPVVIGGGGLGGYGYGGYGGYGYDPTPGLVFGAVNAIGNGMRESRQNDMIRTQAAELNQSKLNEQEMAARIRQLEMMQMQQGNGGQQQGQPQTIIVQSPADAQKAAAPTQ